MIDQLVGEVPGGFAHDGSGSRTREVSNGDAAHQAAQRDSDIRPSPTERTALRPTARSAEAGAIAMELTRHSGRMHPNVLCPVDARDSAL
jgi:hypothetical protein